MKNSYYIRNPNICFRNEKTHCVSYLIDDFFHMPEFFSLIGSSDVIFILLFDGKKPCIQVFKEYAYLFNVSYDSEDELFEKYSKKMQNLAKELKISPLFIESSTLSYDTIEATNKLYNIKDFVISSKVQLEALNRVGFRLSSPASINFNVTTICDFSCKYCYHQLLPITDYISIERFDEIAKELYNGQCESVLLSGGNPILRSDFDELVKVLAKNNLYYTISTKSVIPEQRLNYWHFDCNMKAIQISLDSLNNEIVNQHLGISDDNYVEKIITMIKFLISIGVRVRVKCVITSKNIHTIIDMVKVLSDIGVETIVLTEYGRTFYRHSDDLFPTSEQFKKVNKDLQELVKNDFYSTKIDKSVLTSLYRQPIRKTTDTVEEMFSHRVACSTGRFSLNMLPNGELTICENLPYNKRFILGDLRKESLTECWNGVKMKEWLSPPPRNIFDDKQPCKTCKQEWYEICHSVYSRCLRFCNETFLNVDTIDISCPKADFEQYRVQ
ncbi:MAG: radical SAM protein [Spirochaetaceae bacterium]|nr:radical SAM protein [Spirochaetaceae bacterium]